MSLLRVICLLAMLVATGRHLAAQPYDWNPTPEKVDILIISSHPDDEGIFMGGVLPYVTQVKGVEALHISMTSGDWLAAHGPPGWLREQELRAADWVYGFRNEPLFPRFKDYPTSTLEQTWDVWADGILGNGDAEEGRAAAAYYVAEQIRRFRPEVIAVQDIDGEYGHNNHRATGIATVDGYELALNPLIDIAGLDAWQPKKFYIHQSEANGLGSPGYTFTNWLFHDYTEEVSIDTNDDGVPDATPREVAEMGLAKHVSQGGLNSLDVSTVYRVGEAFDGHHSEWWGLYRSTVGPDTLTNFERAGRSYNNWAVGDFFENVFEPPIFSADINQDGIVFGDGTGLPEYDDVTAFILGWGTTGHVTNLDKLMHGDINLDGRTSLADWQLLVEALADGNSLNLASLLSSGHTVPEPSSVAMLGVVLLCLVPVAYRGKRRLGLGST